MEKKQKIILLILVVFLAAIAVYFGTFYEKTESPASIPELREAIASKAKEGIPVGEVEKVTESDAEKPKPEEPMLEQPTVVQAEKTKEKETEQETFQESEQAKETNQSNQTKKEKTPGTYFCDENTLKIYTTAGGAKTVKPCESWLKCDAEMPGCRLEQLAKGNCTDTDNGINYFIKGTVDDTKFVLTDNCPYPFSLVEYYCGAEGAWKATTIKCDHGCRDGACQKE